jgi:hypothetical protein
MEDTRDGMQAFPAFFSTPTNPAQNIVPLCQYPQYGWLSECRVDLSEINEMVGLGFHIVQIELPGITDEDGIMRVRVWFRSQIEGTHEATTDYAVEPGTILVGKPSRRCDTNELHFPAVFHM